MHEFSFDFKNFDDEHVVIFNTTLDIETKQGLKLLDSLRKLKGVTLVFPTGRYDAEIHIGRLFIANDIIKELGNHLIRLGYTRGLPK